MQVVFTGQDDRGNNILIIRSNSRREIMGKKLLSKLIFTYSLLVFIIEQLLAEIMGIKSKENSGGEEERRQISRNNTTPQS